VLDQVHRHYSVMAYSANTTLLVESGAPSMTHMAYTCHGI